MSAHPKICGMRWHRPRIAEAEWPCRCGLSWGHEGDHVCEACEKPITRAEVDG